MSKLFMLLIGCLPKGRHTEQHDVFFGVGNSIRDVLQDAMAFWPEAKSSFHLDAWREVNLVDGYRVIVEQDKGLHGGIHLFFINLGGYKRGEFEEYHYKTLVAAKDKHAAVRQAKETTFFKHTGFKGATAHIDDKYGIDVDDIFIVKDILPPGIKSKYHIRLIPPDTAMAEDEIHLGYFKPDRIDKWAPPSTADNVHP